MKKEAEQQNGIDYTLQTFAIHEYLYGCMQEMRPKWKVKWDAALAEERWEDVRTVMAAIMKLLPETEQAILEPAMRQFEPWEDELRTFMPSVWIIDRFGTRHGHIGLLIKAKNKDVAMEQIRKRNYELRSW